MTKHHYTHFEQCLSNAVAAAADAAPAVEVKVVFLFVYEWSNCEKYSNHLHSARIPLRFVYSFVYFPNRSRRNGLPEKRIK